MPSTIITTVGASDANSYVDATAADAYFDDRLEASKWNSSTTDNQTRALFQAAKRLNTENWQGSKAGKDQALAWPRVGAVKVDGVGSGAGDFVPGAGALLYPRTGYGIYAGGYGEQYKPDEIPQPVKDAQCELAIAYLEGYPGSVIKELTQGGVTVEIEHPSLTGGLPPRVMQLIGGLIAGNRLTRG